VTIDPTVVGLVFNYYELAAFFYCSFSAAPYLAANFKAHSGLYQQKASVVRFKS
jgi:hypothetical protein